MVDMIMETVERLARIESAQEAMKESLQRITGFLERSVTERTVQHTETVKQLAVIDSNQQHLKADFQEYQKDCTAERATLVADVNTLKTTVSNQSARMGGIAAAISFIIASGGAAIEWLRHP